MLVRFDGYDEDVKALIGTDAASMVSEAVVNSDFIDTSRNHEFRLKPAMGNGLTKVIGFIQLQVKIGRCLYEDEFVVVPSSYAFEMTLGADFLRHVNVHASYATINTDQESYDVPLLDRFDTSSLSAQLVRVPQPLVEASRKHAGSPLGPPGRRRY